MVSVERASARAGAAVHRTIAGMLAACTFGEVTDRLERARRDGAGGLDYDGCDASTLRKGVGVFARLSLDPAAPRFVVESAISLPALALHSEDDGAVTLLCVAERIVMADVLRLAAVLLRAAAAMR